MRSEMRPDIEDAVREALHHRVRNVTADRLPAREPVVRGAWRGLLHGSRLAMVGSVAAVVVAALAIGLGTSLIRGSQGEQRHVAGQDSPASAVGYIWYLTAISKEGAQHPVPAAATMPSLRLEAGGEITWTDGVNSYTGNYRLTKAGFAVSDVAGTGAGYAGNDPAVLSAMAAMAELDGSHAIVIEGDMLRVTTASYTLTFHRGASTAVTSPAAAAVGFRWRLVSVSDGTSRAVPPSMQHVELALASDLRASGGDGGNTHTAKFSLTATGIAIGQSGTTFKLYQPTDPVANLVLSAVGRLFTDPSRPTSSRVTATMSEDGVTLRLVAGPYTLTYARDGIASDVPMPTPTSSGSAAPTSTGSPTPTSSGSAVPTSS